MRISLVGERKRRGGKRKEKRRGKADRGYIYADFQSGGAAGVIFDMCTTTALGPLARGGFWEYVSLPFFDYANKRK